MSGPGRALVLDANILVRLVLGTRVRELVLAHLDAVQFFTPRECFEDAAIYRTSSPGAESTPQRRWASSTGSRA